MLFIKIEQGFPGHYEFWKDMDLVRFGAQRKVAPKDSKNHLWPF